MTPDSLALSPAPFSAGPAAACPSPRRSLTTADLLNRVVSARDLDKHPSPPPPWLWQGYLGPGKVTLLTKTGSRRPAENLMIRRMMAASHERKAFKRSLVRIQSSRLCSETSPSARALKGLLIYTKGDPVLIAFAAFHRESRSPSGR
jgi:hypothetical protein